jgi:hypothetical protein
VPVADLLLQDLEAEALAVLENLAELKLDVIQFLL